MPRCRNFIFILSVQHTVLEHIQLFITKNDFYCGRTVNYGKTLNAGSCNDSAQHAQDFTKTIWRYNMTPITCQLWHFTSKWPFSSIVMWYIKFCKHNIILNHLYILYKECMWCATFVVSTQCCYNLVSAFMMMLTQF